MKIKYSELADVLAFKQQGLSASTLYTAKYKGEDVIVKAQKEGTRASETDNVSRFEQELKILELDIPNVVSLYGSGNDFLGENFVVIEKLYPLEATAENIQEIANTVTLAARQVYLHGLLWTVSDTHVLQTQEGGTKIIDFNDCDLDDTFITTDKHHDFRVLLDKLCSKVGVKSQPVIKQAIDNLIKVEYQSLENVHEPIYFEEYSGIKKRITEATDPNYGKLRKANRRCSDRATLILEGIGEHKGTVLDIGSNLGWFCFDLNRKGYKTTGVDFDKNFWEPNRGKGWPEDDAGKIKFCQLLSSVKQVDVGFENANVNTEYIENMPEYDIIMALSILHLYFQQHKVSKDYWIELFKLLTSKAKKVFIFEVSNNILGPLGLKSQEELMQQAKIWGGFKNVYSKGKSDAKRPIIICEK